MRHEERAGKRGTRNGYLVLGMHRSGTSAVSGTLAKLGAAPPKTLLFGNPDNPRGHWESVALIQLHDELLASAGSKWDDWRPINSAWHETPVAEQFRDRGRELLFAEFGNAPSFVLKDPRICRFARFWLDIFAEEGITPRLLLPVRQPLEVAQSLKTRDGFSLNKGLLLWLRHALEAEAVTRDLPRTVIDWDTFLKDWRLSLDRAAIELGASWPGLSDFTAAEVDAFLSDELKHERISAEVARTHPDMHDWAVVAYEALLELAKNPGSNSARSVLDDVKKRFDEATSLFGRTLGDLETATDTLQHALASERHARAQEAASYTSALDAERARIADTQRLRDEEREVERTRETEMLRVRDQTVSDLQYALAAERALRNEEAANSAAAMDAEHARVAELQRVHQTTLSDLGAMLADERQARERADAQHAELSASEQAHIEEFRRASDELNNLQSTLMAEREAWNRRIADTEKTYEAERLRIEEMRRVHEDAINSLTAALTSERQAGQQKTEDLQSAQENAGKLESAQTDTLNKLESALAAEQQAKNELSVLYGDLQGLREKIHRAKTQPFRSFARWMRGKGV